MRSVFISDLHLDEQRPKITALLFDFLDGGAAHADRLYVLGDLFEAWIGDDYSTALSQRVASAFWSLSRRSVPIAFIHGNRDFLLGTRYADQCGMELLPDQSTIHLDGQPVLIAHGDTLCTDDIEYQAIRETVRDPAWMAAFLEKPIEERLAFAAQARSRSRTYTASAPEAIMDVNPGAVATAMSASGVTRMIHGHTHRPAVHEMTLGGRSAWRYVLADWYQSGSCLVHEDGVFDSLSFS